MQNFQDTIYSVKGTTMQTRTSNIILARRSSRRCLAVTSSQMTNLEPEISLVVSENHLVEEAASPLTRSWLPICMCFYKALFSFFWSVSYLSLHRGGETLTTCLDVLRRLSGCCELKKSRETLQFTSSSQYWLESSLWQLTENPWRVRIGLLDRACCKQISLLGVHQFPAKVTCRPTSCGNRCHTLASCQQSLLYKFSVVMKPCAMWTLQVNLWGWLLRMLVLFPSSFRVFEILPHVFGKMCQAYSWGCVAAGHNRYGAQEVLTPQVALVCSVCILFIS